MNRLSSNESDKYLKIRMRFLENDNFFCYFFYVRRCLNREEKENICLLADHRNILKNLLHSKTIGISDNIDRIFRRHHRRHIHSKFPIFFFFYTRDLETMKTTLISSKNSDSSSIGNKKWISMKRFFSSK